MLRPLASIPEANEEFERSLEEEFEEMLQLNVIPSSFEGGEEVRSYPVHLNVTQPSFEECLSNEEAVLKAIKNDVQAMEKAERKPVEQFLRREGGRPESD